MENTNWLDKNFNIFENHTNTIKSFIVFLESIIRDNNLEAITEISKMIHNYNTRKSSSNSSSSSIKIEHITEEDDDVEDDDEEEDKKEESKEETKTGILKNETTKTEGISQIYQDFINNNNCVDKLYMKPNYDINKNIENFVERSNKY